MLVLEKISEKKKEAFHSFLINYCLLFVTWSGMFRKSFNCDTLFHYAHPEVDILGRCEGGRYLSGLMDYILYQFGLTTADHTGITVFIAVFLLAVSLWLVQFSFREHIKCRSLYQRFAYYAIFALIFSNVLFSESLMFAECSLMFGLGYLFASMGIWFFTRGTYGISFLLFLCAAMEYQVAVAYGAIILSAWIFLHNEYKITARTVMQELICALVTFGAGLLDMLSISLFVKLGVLRAAEKTPGLGNMAEKIGVCIRDFIVLLQNCRGLLPKIWLPLLVMAFACGVTLWKFIKDRNGMAILYYCLLIAAMSVMVYALPLAQAYINPYPRMVWIFYVMQSMALLIALPLLQEGKWRLEIFCYVCCGYLALQVMFCHIIVSNHMLSNALDRTYAMMFYEEVLKYEAKTGIQVEKLGVANDTDAPLSYNNVHYKTDQINERALGMVTNTLVNVVTKRQFEKVPMDETIFQERFAGKNWDYFNAAEQIVFDGDTAYWVIF